MTRKKAKDPTDVAVRALQEAVEKSDDATARAAVRAIAGVRNEDQLKAALLAALQDAKVADAKVTAEVAAQFAEYTALDIGEVVRKQRRQRGVKAANAKLLALQKAVLSTPPAREAGTSTTRGVTVSDSGGRPSITIEVSDAQVGELLDIQDDELTTLIDLLMTSITERLGSPADHLTHIRNELKSVKHVRS